VDEYNTTSSQNFLTFYRKCHKQDAHAQNSYLAGFDTHFIVSPVEGVTACYQGLAGALSVLAGGRPGSFKTPSAPWYLVIATAPGLIEAEWPAKLNGAL